jgi:hypothetical protein
LVTPLVELLSSGSDEGRAEAAGALWNLAVVNNANREAVLAAGALPPLVDLLIVGSDKGRAYAAGALGDLSNGTDVTI